MDFVGHFALMTVCFKPPTTFAKYVNVKVGQTNLAIMNKTY